MKVRIEGDMSCISVGVNVGKKSEMEGADAAKKNAKMNYGKKLVMDDKRDRYEISCEDTKPIKKEQSN